MGNITGEARKPLVARTGLPVAGSAARLADSRELWLGAGMGTALAVPGSWG